MMKFDEFKKFIEIKCQEDFYSSIQLSYGQIESSHPLSHNLPIVREISWNGTPNAEILKRFFNQVNTHYGEKYGLKKAKTCDPIGLLV